MSNCITKYARTTALLACALFCLLEFSACETCPRDKATTIATAAYPGKNEVNSCKIYADSLCKALAQNNIQAWRVWYFRNNKSGPCGHAMVVYKDAGSYWCVDNEYPKPSKCSGTTPKEWAQERDNMWLTDGGNANMPVNFGNANAIVGVCAVEGGTLLARESRGTPGRASTMLASTARRSQKKPTRIASAKTKTNPLAGVELSMAGKGRKLARNI